MSLIKEFREFAMKGNVVDLAVGVIIGAAFGKIVTSLVNDIIMPPIGKIMGGADFKDLFHNLDPQKLTKAGASVKSLADAKEAGAAVVAYGAFLNTLIDFVIVAFCIFMLVKAINRFRRKLETAPPPAPPAPVEPPPSKEALLLSEIRDLLRSK